MASNEVQKQFAERGVELISPSAGPHFLNEELRFGRKGQVEVIIGNGPWGIAESERVSSVPDIEIFPLLKNAQLTRTDGGTVEVKRTLDSANDLYLQDHVLDKNPVLPMAMAMELMAEVARRGWPETRVLGIQDLRVLRGIVLHDGNKNIRTVARPQMDVTQENSILEVQVEIEELDKPGRPCYQANVQLGERLPAPPEYDPSSLTKLHPFPMTVEEAYRRWLFHGPRLQGISMIEGMNEKGICAILKPSSLDECFYHQTAGEWLIDPVVLDSSFQLAILWERAHHDMTPLPSRLAAYRSYGQFSRSPIRCYLHAQSSNGGQTLMTTIYFLDSAHRLLGLMEGMEFSCSKALNRLAEFNK